jgi:alpha-tubulin suppressor-like RCC1 family protein
LAAAGLRARAIAASRSHTCIVNDTDNVYCWGNDGTAQLGYGSPLDDHNAKPYKVSNPLSTGGTSSYDVNDAASITTGRWHTCVTLKGGAKDGTTKCWGRGDSGQLGDGDREDHGLPVP